MPTLALWLAVLILVSACSAPRAATVRPSKVVIHEPTSAVPYRWTDEIEPVIHGDATDDLVSADGRRIPAPQVFLNGIEQP